MMNAKETFAHTVKGSAGPLLWSRKNGQEFFLPLVYNGGRQLVFISTFCRRLHRWRMKPSVHIWAFTGDYRKRKIERE
ncbi:hypothetical protein T458_21030 [Brevibacillus panacihumi W25]|uniref:Uncharacterized protein n=1 Tax=Brevibacillus panacihumi W25 TaxID=1408254 RepID=V6M5R5_9BACL|nr:hypothetical protein T458_21030 [Brevibacillus panacihumi W25]